MCEVLGRVDDQDPHVIDSGAWANWNNSTDGNYGDTIKYLQNPTGTETASLTFRGTGIEVVTVTNYDRGYYEVTIDGKVVAERVDTYSATSVRQKTVYSKTGLEPGVHTIVLRATGTKNASSSLAKVELDAFNVIDTSAKPVTGVTVRSENGMTLLAKDGSTLQMVADVKPADARVQDIAWSVATKSGSATGTISEDGLLAASGEGVLTVTAACGDISGSLDVTLAPAGTVSTAVEDCTHASRGCKGHPERRRAPHLDGWLVQLGRGRSPRRLQGREQQPGRFGEPALRGHGHPRVLGVEQR